MAHVNKRGIVQMVNHGVVRGVKIDKRSVDWKCDGCANGKAHPSPIPTERTSDRATGLLDRVHSDVCGPLEVPSIGGSRYFATFNNEHSNWVTVFLLKRKSEVAECFLNYEKVAERHTGRKIRALRSDRGGEYLSEALQSYFKHQGIHHELTTAYTPSENGIAERFNCTVLDLVRSMLHHNSSLKYLWAEALSTAVYTRNRVTSRALPSNTTPYHVWMGKSPVLSHLRVFGSKCCMQFHNQK